MNVKLSDEYTLKCDPLNYELSDGRVSLFFRTLNEAIERFLELNRRDKLKRVDGNTEDMLKAVTQINIEAVENVKKCLQNINIVV